MSKFATAEKAVDAVPVDNFKDSVANEAKKELVDPSATCADGVIPF
jgi:hypothetical protein